MDDVRCMAMNQLGNGLHAAGHYEDALSLREDELSKLRRLGASGESLLVVQGNIAGTYDMLGRLEDSLRMQKDVYSGTLRLLGKEHYDTLREANNYGDSLASLGRLGEAKSLLLKIIPVARRVLGGSHDITLKMRWSYARALHMDEGATDGDLREAVNTLEETERTARCVLGVAHPTAKGIETALRKARAALRAREPPPGAA
jgi:hypothetical protein